MLLLQRYRSIFGQKGFLVSTILGLLFLGTSIWLNYVAGTYAYRVMSHGVTDLILDLIPVYDVQLIFIDGAILCVAVGLLMTLWRPQYLPFVAKTVALLYLFRSLAIILTHLGPPVGMENLYLANTLTQRFIFGADYFFSGHTALPLMFAFTFWQNKIARHFFFFSSALFATTALLGHVHYSIDIFAAPFIAYSTFVLSEKLFRKDVERIRHS